MKNKADILKDHDTNEVVVIDKQGKEIFRKPYTKQFISIAHDIYMCAKYKERAKEIGIL